MILTVTPNPSLDLLFRAERLVWDDANRIPLPRRRPGGQGINVVRAVRALDPRAPARAQARPQTPGGKATAPDNAGRPRRDDPAGPVGPEHGRG